MIDLGKEKKKKEKNPTDERKISLDVITTQHSHQVKKFIHHGKLLVSMIYDSWRRGRSNNGHLWRLAMSGHSCPVRCRAPMTPFFKNGGYWCKCSPRVCHTTDEVVTETSHPHHILNYEIHTTRPTICNHGYNASNRQHEYKYSRRVRRVGKKWRLDPGGCRTLTWPRWQSCVAFPLRMQRFVRVCAITLHARHAK